MIDSINPLVSILMVTYNHEKYIAESIESVLKSSYSNWELIISDDCSGDNTFEIAQQYANRDARIKLITPTHNLGDYPNRNFAASHAKGKYLKYLDGDDVIYKYSLEVMLNYMESYPQCVLGICLNIIDFCKPYPFTLTSNQSIRSEFLNVSYTGCGPSATIINKKLFDSIGGFSGEQYLGDSELWLKIISKHEILILPPSLVWWRTHPNQQSISESKDNIMPSRRLKVRLNYLMQNKDSFNNVDFEIAQSRIFRNYTRQILSRGLKRFELPLLITRILRDKIPLKYWLLGLIKYDKSGITNT